ncbi:RecF/RecN/SMC protein [Neoconidiobolus thromboides FSU 785]|nr:RecF/RecN/SMC protein [Neoconidiobolus thromboides FSU 785]
MVLRNFKSYAGTQIIGPFHESFSAVVGPNGSGKSNVIDSLLFVFGYRANKMRQGKLSELIHNSKDYPNLESCSVEVHFVEINDSGDSSEYIPNTELIIKRSAFRNNTSRYFINERVSSYTEVTDLLRNKGIDLDHKRFLILQGEVESISQMKPKALNDHDDGLLEYLEDIIGTSQYKEPIENASIELEKATEVKQEKLNRMKIVEKELKSLEVKNNTSRIGKKLEADEYLREENEHIKKQNMYFQIKKLESIKSKEIAFKKLNNLKEQLEGEKEKNSETSQKIKELERKHKKLSQTLAEVNKKVLQVKKEEEAIDTADIKLQFELKHINGRIKKIKERKRAAIKKIGDSKRDFINCEAVLEKCEIKINEDEKTLEVEEKKLEKIREDLEGKTKELRSKIDEKQKELIPWNEKINQKQIEIDVIKSRMKILNDKENAYDGQLKAFKNIVNMLSESQVAKQEQLPSLVEQKDFLIDEINTLEKEIEQDALKDSELLSKYQQAQLKQSEAESTMNNAKARNKVIQAIIRQKELGLIHGIHGRLGDLGSIDAKYDVAISTACPQLEHIIVDTIETAQQCIKFLRDNNVGRATFMALNSIKKESMHGISTPENVPRLFDLITPKDPIYSQAFYNNLRNTLVAKDLDQARRVGMGQVRWRVVTLKGDMVEKSGTMSGGGKRVSRGAMGSSIYDDPISPEKLQKLNDVLRRAQEELYQFRQRLKVKEDTLEKDKIELPRIETEIAKLEMDLESLESQIQDGKKRYTQFKQTAPLTKEEKEQLASYKSEIEILKEDMVKLESDSQAIRKDIDEFHQKVLEAGGTRLRIQNSTVESIKNVIEEYLQNKSRTLVAKDKAEKDQIKAEKEVERLEIEQESVAEEYKLGVSKIEENAKLISEVDSKKEAIDEEKTGIETQIEEVKVEMEQISESINDMKALELDLTNKIYDQQQQFKGCEKHEGHWDNQLKTLALKDVYEDKEARSGNEDMMDEYEIEDEQNEALVTYSREELEDQDLKELENAISAAQNKLKHTTPNLGVIVEYRKKNKDFLKRKKEFDNVSDNHAKIKKDYDELKQTRHFKFMEGFSAISYKLKEMYQMITLGGNAELELVDNLDPFAEGIIFSVMPPKKSWKNISNLSGGEKTLSSLALVFALHHFKPTPLYVMDEIDAALDFRNVSIVANYIKERTKDAQFIIISLRNNMFEMADRLVGIYKTHDCTKSITINPDAINMPS